MGIHLNQKHSGKTPLQGTSSSGSIKSEFTNLVRTLAIFLVVVIFLRASVVEAFKIPSQSMEPTLQVGDHILVNKLSYGFRLPFVTKIVWLFSGPQRGDVVVFTRPDDPMTPDFDESDTNIIKRIIGLPGEVIEIDGTAVFVDGNRLPEKYARWLENGKKDFGPVRIPEGKVLLLGDNRDHSLDSRYWNDNFLEIERIKGKAFLVYWNINSLTRIFSVIQ